MTPALVLALLLALLGVEEKAPGAPPELLFSVPVEITEDQGIARRDEPVTFGVPLPRFPEVLFPRMLGLLGSDGKTVLPSQIRVLSRWHGSRSHPRAPLRWVLVTARLGCPASGSTRVFLSATRDTFPAATGTFPALEVTETSDSILVDTGVARFAVSRDRFDLLRQVWIDKDGDGEAETALLSEEAPGGLVIRRNDESPPHLSLLDNAPSVTLEETGPERCLVVVRARIDARCEKRVFRDQLSHLDLTAWYSFHRGSPEVRVQLALRYPERRTSKDIQKGGPECVYEMEDLSLVLPLVASSDAVACFPGEHPVRVPLSPDEITTLYQDSSGGPLWGPPTVPSPYWATSFRGYQVRISSTEDATLKGGDGLPLPLSRRPFRVTAQGLRAPGILEWSSDQGQVAVALRDVWQCFPKALRATPGRIEIALFPGEYAVPHHVPGGVQKTHDLWLRFAPPGPRSEETSPGAREFLSPLLVRPEPGQLLRSEALGLFSLSDPGLFPFYEESSAAVLRYAPPPGEGRPDVQGDVSRERDDKDLYGWLNYGDHYRGGSKNRRTFGNNELDFSRVMLLEFLRRGTPDRLAFDNGRAMARHLMDVDIYHTDRDLPFANHGVRKHDADEWADHSRPPNLSHFWLSGLSLWHHLTGDPGAEEALLEVGRWLAAFERDPKGQPGILDHCNEIRSRGWAILGSLDLYDLTGDVAWIERARRIVHGMVVEPLGTGSFLWSGNEFRKGYGGDVVPWQMAYVTEALGRYLWTKRDRGEEDPKALDALLRMCAFLDRECWDKERGVMCYVWDSQTRKPSSFSANLSQTAADGFAYAYLLTSDESHREAARRFFDAGNRRSTYPAYYTTTLGTPAKNRCFQLRFGQVTMAVEQMAAGRLGEPTINSVQVVEFRGGSALLRVHASCPVSARIAYGTSKDDQRTAHAKGFATRHDIWVRDVQPGETFSAAAMVVDLAGKRARSEKVEFTVPRR
jgi:hypothetical protein